MNSYDIAIIGGGIVGMATAMAILRSENPPKSLIVLEAENKLAIHQSGHNSGVIHSGLYYTPGSYKAELCTQGREAMYQFCKENNIKHKRCGKLVIATNDNEIPHLHKLKERGIKNGLDNMKFLNTCEEIKEYEPNATGSAALHVPDTGVVNFSEVTQAMADIVKQHGGDIKTSSNVKAVAKRKDEYILFTPKEIKSRFIINCAGLQADRVARLCEVNPRCRIIPFRGEYSVFSEEGANLVNNLIYPVPNPSLPFLGVHLTRGIDDCVEAGPNAILALSRSGYGKRSTVNFADIWSTLSWPGFWRMALSNMATGLSEWHRAFSKVAFLESARKLIPELQESHFISKRVGIRAQAVDLRGCLIDDFHIIEDEKMIHVLNAPSPAATASIAIGKHIANLFLYE